MLVRARLDGANVTSLQPDMTAAARRADEIDGKLRRGALLVLPGVPFVAAGEADPLCLASLERAGAIRIGGLGCSGSTLAAAAETVKIGAAAFAVIAGLPAVRLAVCDVHALNSAGQRLGFLARSCRDLALVVDVALGQASAHSSEIICRPLTDSVGHGASSLAVAVTESANALFATGLADRLIHTTVIPAPADALEAEKLVRFDAIVSDRTIPVPYRPPATLFLPVPAPGGRASATLCIFARETGIAVRLGAAVDAQLLAYV